jgi:hypothetical protein
MSIDGGAGPERRKTRADHHIPARFHQLNIALLSGFSTNSKEFAKKAKGSEAICR